MIEHRRPVIEARGVTKRFGSFVALRPVDFSLYPGEIHALVGENGAGKSTLMGLLYGVHEPDEGVIAVDGRPVRFHTCADAMRAGIGMVFQHFLLVERFTAAENVLLGREPVRGGLLDEHAADAVVARLAADYRFALDPRMPVEKLGVGARQQVELLKVLERDARVIILDEPTASLSPTEGKTLLGIARRLRDEGRAIALVSHKLAEVIDVADRITVLREGEVVGSMRAADADASTLASMMIGRHVDLDARPSRTTSPGGSFLQVTDLHAVRDDGAPAVRGCTLAVREGEIVGLAGVEGNGQAELADCLYGLRAPVSGRIAVDGRDVSAASPTQRRRAGIRYIPADRMREGLVLEFDAEENALLGDQRMAGWPLLDVRRARELAGATAREYGLATVDPHRAVATYSGGMQQKVIAGRELRTGARLVIAVSPTRGVDIGAAEVIHARLRQVRDEGAGILLVSYDLDEIRALADRILVIHNGAIAGELAPAEATDDALGRLMGGLATHA